MADYLKALKDIWDEMEKLFHQGKFHGEQEGDVQAYLYHGFLLRLKGLAPKDLRMEKTFDGIGRVDLSIRDKLFIEIKKLSRKKSYHERWDGKLKAFEKDVDKLKRYCKNTKSRRVRTPVFAIWNRRANQKIGLDGELLNKLEKFKRKHKKHVLVVYGPK